jgi:hypothetical protein
VAEDLATVRAAYDIVRGQLSETRKEYSDLMGEMLEWRRRAHKAERSVRALIADPPPVPDGTDDDEARRGYADRTVVQWRKYSTHWRERAETAERQLAEIRRYIDEDFRFWCSPHGVAGRYAKDLVDFIDRLDDREPG